MFYVNKYKVVFKRNWHNREVDFHDKYVDGDGRYDTICEIYTVDDTMVGSGFRKVYHKEPTFTGIAKLHPNDKPDKIIGKKIALKNAISNRQTLEEHMKRDLHHFDKEVRTAIWKAFFSWVTSWKKAEKI